MPHKKADAALLWDMLDAAEAINMFVSGKTFYHYQNDRMLRGAVERHLEIIGEAGKGVSKTCQKAHPEIPWHRIIAQRHVLAHEYGEIKQELIWKVATLHIPELIGNLKSLVPSLPEIDEIEGNGTSPSVLIGESLKKFDWFIGIDWSGARKPNGRLQVAQCSQGTAVPQIVPNPTSPNWSRNAILDWLIELHNTGQKVLAGFDFAFAYPYCDKQAYFHGHDGTPKDAESLWELIDDICQDARDFYGGPFYLNQDAPFSDYLLYQTYRGNRYSPRKRKTENHCTEMGGNPASVFKCVGPESVGIGSLAGMRLLHRVNSHLNRDFIIWPFQGLDNRRSVFVEIFPRLFYKLAGQNPKEWRNRNTVNNALKWFGSDELPPDLKNESEDQIDAIISAAALRHLSKNPRTWQSEKLTKCARDFEGWIFGAA